MKLASLAFLPLPPEKKANAPDFGGENASKALLFLLHIEGVGVGCVAQINASLRFDGGDYSGGEEEPEDLDDIQVPLIFIIVMITLHKN